MKYLFIIIVFFTGCAIDRILPAGDITGRDYRTSDRTMFNYEDSASQYSADTVNEHFRIRIEIEEPYIIRSADIIPDRIYSVSEIEGVAVFHATVDSEGKIISKKLVRSAGLGLDETALKIIESIVLSPGRKENNSGSTDVSIRIIFSGRKKL